MRISLAGWKRSTIYMLGHDRIRSIPAIWRLASTDLVQHHAERVDVAPLIARLPLDLFWRDVDRRTHGHPGRCHRGRSHHLHNPKVGQDGLAHGYVHCITSIKQNIGRLNIAVNHTLLVGIVDSEANRSKKTYN